MDAEQMVSRLRTWAAEDRNRVRAADMSAAADMIERLGTTPKLIDAAFRALGFLESDDAWAARGCIAAAINRTTKDGA